MLKTLSIRNIVLIEALTLSFAPGLGILTGETGGGKSILLDALNLALGQRADPVLVRQGQGQGGVTAEFELAPEHPAFALARSQGLSLDPGERQLILRRIISANGRSRAFVNDQAVTAGLLRTLGEALVEVHGQHDDRGLLNPKGHRALLDAFGGLEGQRAILGEHYAAWRRAKEKLQNLKTDMEEKHREKDYDRHCLEELQALGPKRDEEATLADERSLMMQGEKASGQLAEILALLEDGEGVETTIRKAMRRLERLPQELAGHLKLALEALEGAANGAEVALVSLLRTAEVLESNPEKLDAVEERLFTLRDLARKHKCRVEDLPALQQTLQAKLETLEQGDEVLVALEQEVVKKRAVFEKRAKTLSLARAKAGLALDKGVAGELAPLKLEKARFLTRLVLLAPDDWGPEGAERAEFEVATNPGAPFGGLMKIASGGELARFILALKVVLASAGTAPCLIFDEVDRGVGGAVANAVGDRLARLAETSQVLAVTHSPQVAARAGSHWRVDKEDLAGGTFTRVHSLDAAGRQEEIARMLSGAQVTDKARAAAGSLIAGAD